MLNAPWRRISLQDVFGGLIGADELAQVQRDDVRVVLAADMVLRDLGAGNHQQIVQALRSLGFGGDVGHVGLEPILGDREVAQTERRQAPGPAEQIALHQDVIGDGDDVEAAGLAVQVDDLADRQPPVAPRRMHMKIAEQKRLVSRHVRPSHQDVRDPRDGGEGSPTRSF